MIKFIIIKDSDAEGHAAGPGVTSLEHSDHVHSIEVAALWSSIKEGRFERQAKSMLEKFCSEHSLDPGELLS